MIARIGTAVRAVRAHPGSASASLSTWANVKALPADPILGLVAAYKEDPAPHAVNVAQGAYRDDEGNPYVLPSVAEAESRIANYETVWTDASGETDAEKQAIAEIVTRIEQKKAEIVIVKEF